MESNINFPFREDFDNEEIRKREKMQGKRKKRLKELKREARENNNPPEIYKEIISLKNEIKTEALYLRRIYKEKEVSKRF